MKRIIDSTLVILSLMLIFGCKESKVGQIIPFSYPKDDTFDPNGGLKATTSCFL